MKLVEIAIILFLALPAHAGGIDFSMNRSFRDEIVKIERLAWKFDSFLNSDDWTKEELFEYNAEFQRACSFLDGWKENIDDLPKELQDIVERLEDGVYQANVSAVMFLSKQREFDAKREYDKMMEILRKIKQEVASSSAACFVVRSLPVD